MTPGEIDAYVRGYRQALRDMQAPITKHVEALDGTRSIILGGIVSMLREFASSVGSFDHEDAIRLRAERIE